MEKRHKDRQRNVQKYVTAVANSRRRQKILNLTEQILRNLGGPEKFLDVWSAEIRTAMQQKRNTASVLRFCECVFRASVAAYE